MPTLVLHPDTLPDLDDNPEIEIEPLEAADSRDDHQMEDGDGVWIPAFLEFLQELVRQRCRLPGFHFSDTDRIDEDILNEIENSYVRNLVIRFANEHYEAWRHGEVSIPDFDTIRSDRRDFCDSCESGWAETYGEYDGPLAEDVDDVGPAGLESRRHRQRSHSASRSSVSPSGPSPTSMKHSS